MAVVKSSTVKQRADLPRPQQRVNPQVTWGFTRYVNAAPG